MLSGAHGVRLLLIRPHEGGLQANHRGNGQHQSFRGACEARVARAARARLPGARAGKDRLRGVCPCMRALGDGGVTVCPQVVQVWASLFATAKPLAATIQSRSTGAKSHAALPRSLSSVCAQVSSTEAALWRSSSEVSEVGDEQLSLEQIVDTCELEKKFCRHMISWLAVSSCSWSQAYFCEFS